MDVRRRLRPYFEGSTFDDVLHDVLRAIRRDGKTISASRSGANLELWGTTLVLTNPLARLSRSEARGVIFSPLGEFCWYMDGSDDADQIQYYIGNYPGRDGDAIFGAYGPRLRGTPDQLDRLIGQLTDKPYSRRAVIQIFDKVDNEHPEFQPPCTCTLQFLFREDALHLIVNMRSNDAVKGLTHDVFCFTMLQEYVARAVGKPLGTYTHVAGSLHLYKSDLDKADQFLAEGHQSTMAKMPPMPEGDPRPGLEELLRAERSLRRAGSCAPDQRPTEPYWADLARLLEVFSLTKSGAVLGSQETEQCERIASEMATAEYRSFITQRLDERVV